MLRRLLPVLMLTVLSGCGSAAFRSSQDWSAVTDERLLRTCQVTNWGSGVWLADGDDGSYVLTCSHLLEGAKQVDVYLVNPATRRYEHFKGQVVLTSDPYQEDLALLRLDGRPSFAAPFKTTLAAPLSPTEPRPADIMNVSFGAEKQPFTRTSSIIALTCRRSDESEFVTKGLFQAGIETAVTEANSGSPVFSGSRLVGLVESVLGGGDMLVGLCTSSPQSIEAFLRSGGYYTRCISAE